MDASTEELISTNPIKVRRVIRWSECDPAGVVYVGNFPGIMLSALYYFRRAVFGGVGEVVHGGSSFQTPAKAIAQVFKSPLWPGDVIEIAAYAGNVREATYDALVLATRQDNGIHVFYGRVTSIFVSAQNRRQRCVVPPKIAGALADYRRHNPPPDCLLTPTTWVPESA